jgi:hypothetical protein
MTVVIVYSRHYVDPRAIEWPERLVQWKITMTPTEIEPATVWFVAQCLNQMRHLPAITSDFLIIISLPENWVSYFWSSGYILDDTLYPLLVFRVSCKRYDLLHMLMSLWISLEYTEFTSISLLPWPLWLSLGPMDDRIIFCLWIVGSLTPL